MRNQAIAAIALVAAASCSSNQTNEPATPVDSGAASLPCDVDEVLARTCRSCHAAPPKFGAPMPLLTLEDLRAAAKSEPGKSVFTKVGERIHDAASPMPPGAKLSAADMAVLDRWVAGGAQPGDGAACADAGAPPDAGAAGPELLPCPPEERTTFLAHGATATEPFSVAADAGNLYQCFTWKAPWTATTQATAFAPVIDDERVVHHWILYETATPQVEGGSKKCSMPFDAKFLQGWAPGATNRVMPPDIGLALPSSDRWLILQLHYWNAAGYTDSRDRSGVSMCTTTNLRPKTAVVSTLGSANIDIAPRSTGTTVTGRCSPTITEPIHILAAAPHMHGRGRRMVTEVLRGGSESSIEKVVDEPSFDFQSQRSYESGIVVRPGDVLRTSCTYDNPTDARVTFGEKTEDEMCFDFLTVWPAPGLFNAGGKATQRCIDK